MAIDIPLIGTIGQISGAVNQVIDAWKKINTPRLIMMDVRNWTDHKLERLDVGQNDSVFVHGGFGDPPADDQIDPNVAQLFQVGSRGGTVATGVEGTLRWRIKDGTDSTVVTAYFDNPWIGTNDGKAHVEGNLGYTFHCTVGSGDKAHYVYDLRAVPVGPWQQLPGSAHDIGIGADGSVWVIGTLSVNGGYKLYHWTGSGWNGMDGGGVRIAVDPSGMPWVVNDAGGIYQRTNNSWRQLPGSAKDIGIGADGQVWVIGTNATGGGFGIYLWTGREWRAIDGGGLRIAVDPNGMPWVVNDAGGIYQRTNSGWHRLPGAAKDIGIGPDGSVWIVGTNPTNGGFGMYHWTGVDWQSIEGGGASVSVDVEGRPWVVKDDFGIARRT